MKLKLNSDPANTSDEVVKNLKAAIRDFEAQGRGFALILKERDALKAENKKLKADLEWYIKKHGGHGLSG